MTVRCEVLDYRSYERLNFEVLDGLGKSIIKCDTDEQALHLHAAVKLQHPHLYRSWVWPKTNWSKDVGYVIHLYDGIKIDHFQYGHLESHKKSGYVVVPFTDLLRCNDFGEIAKSEFDIKSLFDMG